MQYNINEVLIVFLNFNKKKPILRGSQDDVVFIQRFSRFRNFSAWFLWLKYVVFVLRYNQLFSIQPIQVDSMDFLRNLFFGPKRNRTSKGQLQLLSLQSTPRITPDSMGHTPIPDNKTANPQSVQNFNFQNKICEFRIKLTLLNQKIWKDDKHQIDWGDLVGIVSIDQNNPTFLSSCLHIRIGSKGQITSLGALRKRTLDNLVIVMTQNGCQFNIHQLILAQQKLIIVFDQWRVVEQFIVNFQKTLFDRYNDCPILQVIGYLLFNITSLEQKFILQFMDGRFFIDQFRIALKKIGVQFQEEICFEKFIGQVTLKDYHDFRQLKGQIKMKFQGLRSKIEKDLQVLKDKEELKRMSLLLSTSENEEDQNKVEPIRKNSSMEADLEAQYFKKRMSEFQTKQTVQAETCLQKSELFYFIEEHDSSCHESPPLNGESTPAFFDKYHFSYRKTRHRSKSEDAIGEPKQEELDDQFFTKY